MMLNYFLSGHMLPLDWLPEPLSEWVRFLPFQYLAYFPASIMLGRHAPRQLAINLAVECGWVLLLFIANRVAFTRGVRRYGAFGG
jgi:ABC-2 type transport system permease protein